MTWTESHHPQLSPIAHFDLAFASLWLLSTRTSASRAAARDRQGYSKTQHDYSKTDLVRRAFWPPERLHTLATGTAIAACLLEQVQVSRGSEAGVSYSPEQNILLLGEVDFSFARALAGHCPTEKLLVTSPLLAKKLSQEQKLVCPTPSPSPMVVSILSCSQGIRLLRVSDQIPSPTVKQHAGAAQARDGTRSAPRACHFPAPFQPGLP